MNYLEIKKKQPTCVDCFFAFSKQQLAEGIKEHHLEGKELFNGDYGLIGTKEGIRNFMGFYDTQSKEIAENCEPQEVYDYEFGNHECDYINDDKDAILIVIAYFGAERAKTVKRMFGHYEIK